MNSEYLLLNAILTQGHMIPAIKRLDESYFRVEEYRSVYTFLKEYYMNYKKVPPPSIIRQSFPTFSYQQEEGSIDFFITSIIEQRFATELSSLLVRTGEKLKSTDIASKVLEFATEGLSSIRSLTGKDEDIDIIATADSRKDAYLKACVESSSHGGLSGITSGFPTLDDVTNGFKGGELITIMGLPGIGKSFLGLHFAKEAWLAGFKPLYISLEMNALQVALRFDALITGLKHGNIKHGKLLQEELKIYKDHLEGAQQGRPKFIVSTPSRCTQTTVFSKLVEHKPDMCVVDYVSLLTDDNGGKEWQAIDNIMKDFKNYAMDKDINIPIMVICQVHRGFDRSSDSLPELADIAHAFSITAHSDIVLALHQNVVAKSENKMRFGVLKNRDGDILLGETVTSGKDNSLRASGIELVWDIGNSIIKESKYIPKGTATKELVGGSSNEDVFGNE